MDISHEKNNENISLAPDFAGMLDEKSGCQGKINSLRESKIDNASPYLPHLLMASQDNLTASSNLMPNDIGSSFMMLVPAELGNLLEGEKGRILEPELATPIDSTIMKALTKDADLYPPVQNKDGSTTYTVVQAGITDRPGRDEGIDYYSRNVDITVPSDSSNLDDCQYLMHPREIITKEEFDSLIEKDKAVSSDIDLYAHGVSTPAIRSDKEALLLQLTNARPTVNLDWNAKDVDFLDPLGGYEADTKAAKRANDNPQFTAAIDDTVQSVGANHTALIGFSHGGYFDTRYLSHRVASELPKLNTVILTHPDVPISAPELRVNGKPELLKDASKHAYVIGGTSDLAMKVAVFASHLLPDSPTFIDGGTEERLGNDSEETRKFIKSEGAKPISESDRDDFESQHFVNDVGIRELLNADHNSEKKAQAIFTEATHIGRTNIRKTT